MIDFSFGICTNNGSFNKRIVESIKRLNIPNYEIIFVGDSGVVSDEHIINIKFDETIKPKWLNSKKNKITEIARYENIVYIHDYIEFDENWYNGFLEFGNDFEIASSVILNNNHRWRDWIMLFIDLSPVGRLSNNQYLLPYNEDRLSKFMYLNGCYWVAKKYVMEEFPLHPDLTWGQSEDVEWSIRVSQKYNFKMNINSTVRILKNKGMAWNIMSDEIYNNDVLPFAEDIDLQKVKRKEMIEHFKKSMKLSYNIDLDINI